MGTRLSTEGNQLLKLLDDGQWHPMAEILAKLGSTVAPGKALRRYEANHQYRVKTYGPRLAPELSMVEQMSSGAKAIATDTLHSLKKRYLEVRDEAGHKWVRRREQPVPVQVRAHHVAPIEFRQVQPPVPETAEPQEQRPANKHQAAAFYTESQVRALLVEELGRAVGELRTFIAEQLDALRPAARRPQPPDGLPPELSWVKRGQLAPLESEADSDAAGL